MTDESGGGDGSMLVNRREADRRLTVIEEQLRIISDRLAILQRLDERELTIQRRLDKLEDELDTLRASVGQNAVGLAKIGMVFTLAGAGTVLILREFLGWVGDGG